MDIKAKLLLLWMLFFFSGYNSANALLDFDEAPKPNIILILADDLGYSDLGCFGSEIETPNLDRLASEGVTFTNFTNCAKCESTRSSLLTGRYAREVHSKKSKASVTIAETLAAGGYQSFISGKWHAFNHPLKRGFDRFFGHLRGSFNFFSGINSRKDKTGKMVEQGLELDGKAYDVGEEFYSTTAITDHAIKFINERDSEKPFFLYLAYNAPHYPLQAPKEVVMEYRGRYKSGWKALRQSRFKRMKELGIVSGSARMSSANAEDWGSLSEEEKDHQDLRMATYAAMIDVMDQNIGRLLRKLNYERIKEETMIVFLSDNGACPFDRTKPETLKQNLMPWDPDSFYCYNSSWANACNTPFRLFKQNQNEGGIATPMIINWPAGIKNKGRYDRNRGHVVDLHATFLELAGVDYPKRYKGNEVGPNRGLSLVKSFSDEVRPLHDELYYRFNEKYSALTQGDWKLVDQQYLYNLKYDRIESNDLSSKYPERFNNMKIRWEELSRDLLQ